MAPNIYWSGGGKGGVGKSLVSMALLDHLTGLGRETVLVETDTSNPDVFKSYKDTVPCELIDLDKADGWIHLVNTVDAHKKAAIVVNTAARSNLGVAKFGGTLSGSLADLGRKMVAIWSINRQRDSLELLREFLEAMPACAVHVARNNYFGDESKFELYAASKTLKPRIESSGGKTLNFPDLADRVADDIYKDRLTIAGAVETLPLGNRAELKRWRAAVGLMLAEVVDA